VVGSILADQLGKGKIFTGLAKRQ